MQKQTDEPKHSPPVFKKCPRCAYSLRGLPVNHACPECGLAYDEDCEMYRATRPTQLFLLWVLIIGGGFSVLQNIPDLFKFDSLSAWRRVTALAAAAWCIFVPVVLWWLVRRYRAGFGLAVTGDGLLINLPALTEDLIPWENITGASVKGDSQEAVLIKGKSLETMQIAVINLKDQSKSLQIGKTGGVFPTRSDVERFVAQVNARAEAPREAGNGTDAN